MATVCIRMSRALYDSIVADLPAYQGDSNIYNWLPTQQEYTEDYVLNPPGENIYFRAYSLNQPSIALPPIQLTVNMFTNIFFTP